MRMRNSVIVFLCVLCFFLSGCLLWDNQPPDQATMQSILSDNLEDFETIVEYILSQDCKKLFIYDARGRMILLKNNSDILVKNQYALDIQLNLKHIWKKGCFSIVQYENTVAFYLWKGNPKDIDCGVVFSADEQSKLDVDYLTHSEPLKESGWHYFVADYELYRVQRAKLQ